MKPFYEQDGIVIYHGDCREILPSIDAQADLIVADPPYGETSIDWDRWPAGWLRACESVSKPVSSLWCFGSMRMFLDERAEFCDINDDRWRFVQDVVWEKHNGSGFLNDRFRRVHEHVAHFVRASEKWANVYKSPRFTMDATAKTVRKKAKPAQWQGATGATTYTSIDGGPRLMRSVLRFRSTHGHALHPTQKPEELVTHLIEYSCPPGGLILSPFVGSGTDLVAAKMTGRSAIGCEVNEEYCEIAANRLSQGVLFGTAGVA